MEVEDVLPFVSEVLKVKRTPQRAFGWPVNTALLYLRVVDCRASVYVRCNPFRWIVVAVYCCHSNLPLLVQDNNTYTSERCWTNACTQSPLQAGAVRSRADQRRATSDWMELEKQRGISITSTVLTFEYNGNRINLLDTPGHQVFGCHSDSVCSCVPR